ncbi:HupE/UreJ family protein, partial [Acinetobacter baumannii]|nr:HupE/UreJ family protein [Acinetobacter baumannii]
MLCLIPAVSQAHPGHDHQSGFSAGFLHPFTGMDHMIMALALGVLLWSAARQWKILGMASMATALVFGFVLGQQQLFSSSLA